MRWRGGVLKPPDQERKKLLRRPASLEVCVMRYISSLDSLVRDFRYALRNLATVPPFGA